MPMANRTNALKVGIVGGRGYLGQALHGYCDDHNIENWIIGRQSGTEIEASHDGYRSSVPDLRAAVRGATTIFHLATVSTPALGAQDPALDLENVSFTVKLIDACRKEGVRHLIFPSSGGTIYGDCRCPVDEDSPANPLCSYAIAKFASERYLRLAQQRDDLDITILRISNVFGGTQVKKGDQGVVGYLKDAILADQDVILFGDTVRDYLYIDDLLYAFDLSMHQPRGFQLYNIGTGVGTTLVALARLIYGLLGRKERFTLGERRPFDLPFNVLRIEKARQSLGWVPKISVQDGMTQLLELAAR